MKETYIDKLAMLFRDEILFFTEVSTWKQKISFCGSEYHDYKTPIPYMNDENILDDWADISNTVAGQINIEREIRTKLEAFDNQNVSVEIAKARKGKYIKHLLNITISGLYKFLNRKEVNLNEYWYYSPELIQRKAVRESYPLTGETLYPFMYAVSYQFCRILDRLCMEQVPCINFYSILKELGESGSFTEKFTKQDEPGQTGEHGGSGRNQLPTAIDTPRAQECFKHAEECGYMEKTDTGHNWTFGGNRGKARLAYFLERVYCPNREDKMTSGAWRSLEKHFNVTRLDSAANQNAGIAGTQATVKEWREKIDEITPKPKAK